MAKNNHTRPKIIELKIKPLRESMLFQARLEWLEARILQLELSVLLLHGDTDRSVRPIPIEERWRGLYEQDRLYVLGRIQAALGNNGIIATKGNIKDALERISNRFEQEHTEDNFTVRQFTPFAMEYWRDKAKEAPDYWEKRPRMKA